MNLWVYWRTMISILLTIHHLVSPSSTSLFPPTSSLSISHAPPTPFHLLFLFIFLLLFHLLQLDSTYFIQCIIVPIGASISDHALMVQASMRNLVYKFNRIGGHWFCRKDWLNCDDDNGKKTGQMEGAGWIRFWGRWARLLKVRINFDCFLCEEREGILRVDGREKYCTDLWFSRQRVEFFFQELSRGGRDWGTEEK